MTALASRHGAGYRLVLRERSNDGRRSLEADVFGPDKMANDPDTPLLLDIVETARGRSLQIGDAVAERIGRLILRISPHASGGLSPREAFIASPVRIYERTMAAGPPPDHDMLDRLGRLGDALLVDYGFAPLPPLPQLMAQTPAAYTYLGQFLAHEMTVWNPTANPALPPFAGPIDSAIDLKTIFQLPQGFPGTLPVHVKEVEGLPLTKTILDSGSGFSGSGLDDVPRLATGWPLLLDPRNDQNLALSQTHVAVTRFAQAAMRILNDTDLSADDIRRVVLRHFQSVVLQDYLVRLVDPATYHDVMTRGRVWVAPSGGGIALHPFYVSHEFSAAIFRFGHAMRRDEYAPWNTANPDNTVDSALASDLLGLSFEGMGLTNGRLLQTWTTDWRHMLGLDAMPPIKATGIGTDLRQSLFCLPKDLFQHGDLDVPCPGTLTEHINLARRTLVSGAVQLLPSGQALAQAVQAALQAAGSTCEIPILAPDALDIPHNPDATAIMREGAIGSRFVDQTPLWVYTLLEAAVIGNGNRLGPLGGRIVAETLNAAIEASGSDMIVDGVRQHFAPDPRFGGTSNDRFDYSDLVRLAFSVNPEQIDDTQTPT
ncbi:hypothetical protein [Loktanella sp. M215]|uniref:hypothetical protein n=1 Tax=Loktanella sp. M215 TaxID=2675431 RepID=UPI001F2D2EEC|nr:hypothetical protein [Loktanella sp. M215]MCF7700862.1 hypothetical protein [Loktanella sp. M215]